MIERAAQLAGSWYPASDAECVDAFAGYGQTAVPYPGAAPIRGGIVPHAGWIFSGRLAYNVLQQLAQRMPGAQTVVLFAGHLRVTSRPTVMTRGRFWTPFGPIETDEELAARLLESCGDIQPEGPGDHSQDNSTEVQLPMLKHLFPAARLLAVGAPPSSAALTVADALLDGADRLGREVVFVGSTDLTHYGPNYGWAPHGTGAAAERWVREHNDPLFIDAVRALDPAPIIDVALSNQNACCPGSAAAAALACNRLSAGAATLLQYATSADIQRSSSFVGYAGMVF